MVTVETRGKNTQYKVFSTPVQAKVFVVTAQLSGDCTLIKYTERGRTIYFEWDGAWVVR